MKNTRYRSRFLLLSVVMIIANLLYASISISACCTPTPYPLAKAGHSMAYDSVNDLIIVYGGHTAPASEHRTYDTRAYDCNNNEWTNLNPSEKPTGSSWLSMAFDSESEKLILFGGYPREGYASAETWIYDYSANTWTQANPSESPALRNAHVMAYDSESDVVIMHGGFVGAGYNPAGTYIHYNDTWAYDYNSNTWTDMSPTGLDVGLAESKMIYDSESDRIIMVGGYLVSPYGNPLEEYYATETWAYDYNTNTWENITTAIHPTHRFDHALSYDSESDRVILVGGHIHPFNSDVEDETWAFDYNSQTWENMNPTNQPVRIAHQMAYDSESDLVILFGGINTSDYFVFYNDIYSYDYNSNTWFLMSKEICPEETDFSTMFPLIPLFSILVVIVIRRRFK